MQSLVKILRNFDVAKLEVSGGTVGEVGEHQPVGAPVVLVDDHDVGVLVLDPVLLKTKQNKNKPGTQGQASNEIQEHYADR